MCAALLSVKAQKVDDAFPDFTSGNEDSLYLNPKIDTVNEGKQFKILIEVNTSLCQGDTMTTINLLNQYTLDFPKSVMTKMVKVKTGQLYIDLGNLVMAETLFNSVLDMPVGNQGVLFYFEKKEICKPIFEFSNYKEANSNACIALNYIEMKRRNYEKALDYLVLAETKYFPSTGCGNGDDMNRAIIQEHFIKYYLSIGDTTNAIKRAMGNLMIGNYSNALLLRQLLLRNHSEKQVVNEVERGILNVYFIKSSDNKRIKTPFSLFEYSIDDLGRCSFDDVREFRKSLMTYRSFKLLKTGKY